MATKKSYIYEIIIDTKQGTASINGTAVALDKLEGKLKQVAREAAGAGKNLGQVTDKTGLAGAAVVELGRTISDANYGFTAMANNISQLSTLFTTLIVTTGGLTNGLKAMWAAFRGPLGLIVVFQIAVAVLEKFAMSAKKGKTNAAELTDEIKNIRDEYDNLLEINQLQLDIAELNGKELNELKKVRKEILADQLQQLEVALKSYEQEKLLAEESAKVRDDWEAINSMSEGWLVNLTAGMMYLGNSVLTDFKDKYGGIVDFIRGSVEVDQTNVEPTVAEEKKISETKKKIQAIEKERLRILKQIDAIDGSGGSEEALRKARDGGLLWFTEKKGTYDKMITADLEYLRRYQNNKEAELEIDRRIASEKKATEEEVFAHKMLMLEAIGAGLDAMGYLIGEKTQEGKAIAAAGALIDTYAAISGQLRAFSKVPIPGYAIAQAIATGLVGFAQVKKIYSVNVPNASGGGSGGGGSTPAPPQNPSFNIIGQSRDTQIRDTIEGALGKPIKAYVTTKDIKSGEELDRNTIRGARVG